MNEEEMKTSSDQIYMDVATGSVGPRDEWWYENEAGEKVNGVDEGALEAVIWNAEVDDWEEGYLTENK
jgi:hypothetical protein